ncbi:MAG: tetratricopeptide repeat protein, partial [Myxococcaceae bacterium]
GSQYKWVDLIVYKKEKSPAKAADEFLKFVAEFPKSENADRALTYSMVIFQDANQIDRGIESGERVLKEYPGCQFELKVRYTLANFYEKVADFQKSAEMYEAFIASYDEAAGPKAVGYENIKELLKKEKEAKAKAAKGKKVVKVEPHKVDPKEKEELLKEAHAWVADAQFNAGLWWEGLARSDKAIAAYQRYMIRFKEKKDVPDLAFNIGLIFEKDKKWPEVVKTFDSFATTYAKDNRVKAPKIYEAKYRVFLAEKQLKNAANVEKLQKGLIDAYGKLSAEDKKNDRVMNAYAQCRFLALEPMWRAYLDIKFSKVANLKNDLAAKLKKIQEVEKSYTEVLQIGSGEYGIAALTRIGLAYADFAQNFLDSPDPTYKGKPLDEEQLEMYRGELENRAFPLEEKAIEGLEKALAKSYELNVYNEWTLQAQEKMNKYRPNMYGKIREVPFRGSEFFLTAPISKDLPVAQAKDAAPAPEAPKPPPGASTAAAAPGSK